MAKNNQQNIKRNILKNEIRLKREKRKGTKEKGPNKNFALVKISFHQIRFVNEITRFLILSIQ